MTKGTLQNSTQTSTNNPQTQYWLRTRLGGLGQQLYEALSRLIWPQSWSHFEQELGGLLRSFPKWITLIQLSKKGVKQLVSYLYLLLGLAQHHPTNNHWKIETWGNASEPADGSNYMCNTLCILHLQVHINSCKSRPHLQYDESNNDFTKAFGITGMLLTISSKSSALTQPNFTKSAFLLAAKPPKADLH